MANGGLLQIMLDFKPALQRFLVLRGATFEEAEDILQDVSVKLSTMKIGPVREERAYLYRMAHNQMVHYRRSADRQARREREWTDANTGDPPELDEEPSAETRLVASQQVRIIERVLNQLPQRTQSIFKRFRVDGEPQRQIAEDLGISISAVEKHLARAYEAVTSTRKRIDEDSAGVRHLRSGADFDGI